MFFRGNLMPIAAILPLLAAGQQRVSVPDAVIEDYSDLLTMTDSGFNDFSGNMGVINKDNLPYCVSSFDRGSGRPASRLRWDFRNRPDTEAYCGMFWSLFGLTDTLVSYNRATVVTESFPEHSLNLNRVDGDLEEPGAARRYLNIGVSLTYQGAEPLSLRLELKDAGGGGRFTRVVLQPGSGRQNLTWDFRAQSMRLVSDLDAARAKVFSIVVERANVADRIRNPDNAELLVDRLWFTPDRPETEPDTDAALLDLAGRRSCQYFSDWASRKPASLGMPQDRSTFADLLSVGGVGFALPCYAIAAERGWLPRPDAASRTLAVLRLLSDSSLYCAAPVGCIGYKGFLYHFLGPDGRRKQNFDYPSTSAREDRNTVEVSTIDTALALVGALAAQSYFNKSSSDEVEIRTLAQRFFDNVDWAFMIEPKSKRFYFGWKPIEDRDDTEAEFLWPDADGNGHYSSYRGQPQVIDYYTDEGFLLTLLSLGATTQKTSWEVHCAPARPRQGGIVRTWSGSLFTFFFTRAFLATEQYDLRPCPDESRVNWLDNSRRAFQEAIRSSAADAWGISAAEGPTDKYRAYGLPALAVTTAPEWDGTVTYYGMLSAAGFGDDLRSNVVQALRAAWGRGHWHHRFALPDAFHPDALKAFPTPVPVTAEAEDGTGSGAVMSRGSASKQRTVWLHAGESRSIRAEAPSPGWYRITVRTSNDNANNLPLEVITVSVDGVPAGSFQPPDTGDGGNGWDVFVESPLNQPVDLLAGPHFINIEVAGGDQYGVEVDFVRLDPIPETSARPWADRARFAIDEGPAALHIENARSGLIWALMKANPNIERAMGRLLPAQTVSAASGIPGAAAASLVSTYGLDLPDKNAAIMVLDSAGALLTAQPLFINQTQANWVTPAAVAQGEATVTIRGSDASPATGIVVFSRLAPALFSADASGRGVAAANLIRVHQNAQTLEPVAQPDSAGRMAAVPIRFGDPADQLYLVLYGTGLRGNSGLSQVAVRVGGETVPVFYCGAQPSISGLDQVNVGPLPRSLSGRGVVDVLVTVDGRTANTLTLTFQ